MRVHHRELANMGLSNVHDSRAAYHAAHGEAVLAILAESTLCATPHVPSPEMKTGVHAAVTVAGKAVLLFGPADDERSVANAKAAAASREMRRILSAAGLVGEPTFAVVGKEEVDWVNAIVGVFGKTRGVSHMHRPEGCLEVLVVMPEKNAISVGIAFSATTKLARIIDRNAPDLDGIGMQAALKRIALGAAFGTGAAE